MPETRKFVIQEITYFRCVGRDVWLPIIKRLREEIAELNKLNRVYLKTPKYALGEVDHERRLQRLLEMIDELNSLPTGKTWFSSSE
jgi:hypothetical protein